MPGDRFIQLAEEDGLRILDALFGQAGEGVSVQHADGHLVYANDHAARMMGLETGSELVAMPLHELIGAFEMLDEAGEPFPPDRLPSRRVFAGEPLAEETVGYRISGVRSIRWSRIRSTPIRDDTGRAVWAINYFHDITAEVRRSAAERLLTRVNLVLGNSLDVTDNLQILSETLVPEVAEWYGIHLLDDQEQLVQVAAEYPESAAAGVLLELTGQQQIDPNSESLAATVMRTRAMQVIDFTRDVLEAAGSDVAGLLQVLGIGSVACLPLGPPDRPIGTVTVARSVERRGFDELDIELLIDISQAASAAIVNAHLYEQEHRVARILSRSLLPTPVAALAGLEVATRHRTSPGAGGLGGDFIESVQLEEGTVALLVADIEGKGIDAAAAVGVVKHTFRAVVRLDPAPETVTTMINDALLAQDYRRMCTFAYLLLRGRGADRELTVTVAGHPPPFLLRAGEAPREVGEPCPPAGLLAGISPKPHVENLRAGDTVLAYTDGFAFRSETPPATLRSLLVGVEAGTVDSLLDGLLARLESEGEAVHDDVVLYGFRVKEA